MVGSTAVLVTGVADAVLVTIETGGATDNDILEGSLSDGGPVSGVSLIHCHQLCLFQLSLAHYCPHSSSSSLLLIVYIRSSGVTWHIQISSSSNVCVSPNCNPNRSLT